MSSPLQRLTRSLAYQGASTLAQSAITLLLMPLVINSAGAGAYGSYVVVNSLAALATSFFTFGAGFQCRRTLPNATDAATRARAFLPSASVQLVSAIGTAAILALALPGLNRLAFAEEVAVHPASIVLTVFALYAINQTDDYFRYTHRIPALSQAIILRSVLQPALVIAAALAGVRLNVNHLLSLQAAAWLTVSGVLAWRISREVPLRLRFNGWPAYRADVLLGFPLISAVVVENLLAATDRYILAAFLPPAAVGAYAAAASLGALLLVFPRMTNSAVLPALTHAVDNGARNEAQRLLRNFMQVFLLLAFPFVVGSALLSAPLLTLIANDQVASTARWAMPIVSVGAVLYGLSYLTFNALFVEKQTAVWFRANATAAVTALALNVALVAMFHRVEAAAVGTCCGYAAALLVLRRTPGVWPWGLDAKLLARSGVACAVMSGAVMGFGMLYPAQSPLSLAARIALGIVVYFGILAAIGGWTPAEMRRRLLEH